MIQDVVLALGILVVPGGTPVVALTVIPPFAPFESL